MPMSWGGSARGWRRPRPSTCCGERRDLSAAGRRKRRYLPAAIASAIALAALAATDAAAAVAHVLMSFAFLGWIALRGLALLHPDDTRFPRPAGADRDLPRYTIVVPLYREARMVAPLLDALGALDYPREKLDILLVVEADDAETRRAIAGVGAPPHVRVVVSPAPGRAHQAQGALRCAAVGPRRASWWCTTPRTGRSPASCGRPSRRFAPGGAEPCLRAGAAGHRQCPRRLADAVVRRANMPACSTRCCRC